MWNAIQGAAGNIASRATQLATDVLETASEEFANGPDSAPLANGAGPHARHGRTMSTDSQGSGPTTSNRLAALKARYKTNGQHGPASSTFTYGEYGRPQSPGFTVSTPKHDREVFAARQASTGSPPFTHNGPMSHPAESAENAKLRDQLHRLKSELVQQNARFEEAVRQREFAFENQKREIESRYKLELDAVKENGHAGVGGDVNGDELAEKDFEISRLRNELQMLQQAEVNRAFGMDGGLESTTGVGVENGNQELVNELETLRADLAAKQSEIERLSCVDQTGGVAGVDDNVWQQKLDAKDAELQQLRTELGNVQQESINSAFGIQGPIENGGSPLHEENESLRAKIQNLESQLEYATQQNDINDIFGLSENPVGESLGPSSQIQKAEQEIAELKSQVERLTQECSQLRLSTDTATVIEERDNFWIKELEQERQAHSGTREQYQQQLDAAMHSGVDHSDQLSQLQEELQASQNQCSYLQGELETEGGKTASAQKEIGDLQQSLQDRDRIWQQELISGQEELQRAKRELEQLKATQQQSSSLLETELHSLREQHTASQTQIRKLEQEIENEADLRRGAEAHVKSMQKSLESQFAELDTSAAGLRSELETERGRHAQSLERLSTVEERYNVELQRSQQNEERIQVLQQQEFSLQKELEELRASYQSVSDQYAEARHHVEESFSSSAGVENEVLGLKSRLTSLEVQLSQSQEENQHLKNELDAVKLELTAAEEKVQTAKLEQKEINHAADSEAEVVQMMQTRLTETELERNRLKEQLNRLKMQMVSMQEDQEASIGWRMDAEVKLAVEEYQKQQGGTVEALKQKLAELETATEVLKKDAQEWEEACTMKDTELTNLQSALGELTYHSEAAEKLRREMRALQEQKANVESDLVNSKTEVAESMSARRAAEAAADRANKNLNVAEERAQALENEAVSLKRALLQASNQVSSLNEDADSMVDRRLVVKLLVTYLERRNSRDALAVMARMLGFTEEERKRVGVDAPRRGLLGAVAGGTMAVVRGGMNIATLGLLNSDSGTGKPGESLADKWVEFLLREAEGDVPNKEDDPVNDPLKYVTSSDVYSTNRTGSTTMAANSIGQKGEAVPPVSAGVTPPGNSSYATGMGNPPVNPSPGQNPNPGLNPSVQPYPGSGYHQDRMNDAMQSQIRTPSPSQPQVPRPVAQYTMFPSTQASTQDAAQFRAPSPSSGLSNSVTAPPFYSQSQPGSYGLSNSQSAVQCNGSVGYRTNSPFHSAGAQTNSPRPPPSGFTPMSNPIQKPEGSYQAAGGQVTSLKDYLAKYHGGGN